MKVVVLVVGKLKERYFRDAEAEYRKRLRPYCNLDVVEVKDDAALLAAVPARARLFVLDERGAAPTSTEFASMLETEQHHGGGAPVAFAIGGADGHSQAIRDRADKVLSFGQMTIAHRLVRLLLIEQIYRAFRIIRGEPYHRE